MTNHKYLTITGKLGNLVYQKTAAGFGNVPGDTTGRLQVKLYKPTNPSSTPAQLASRQKFRNAVAAYRTLSPEALHALKIIGAKRGITGYNLFLGQFMKDAY
jgi:hypothetical protein